MKQDKNIIKEKVYFIIRKINMEENNNEIKNADFKDLTIKEQITELEKKFEVISQKIYQERSTEILSGSIEIEDISYNLTSDNNVVYDITIRDTNTGEEVHEFYNKDLDKIDTDKSKIQDMKLMGYDTSVAEKQIEEIDNLENNPDKISLLELKEHDQEIDEVSKSLEISREDVSKIAIIDANQGLKVKANELGGLPNDLISANEKVNVHYNMGDLIGGDFVSYQIIKTNDGIYKLFGIDKNNYAQEINQDIVEKMNITNQTVKLIQENGEVKEAKIQVAFRMKSQSDVDRDQVVGICDDGTSDMTSFYGRGVITNDQIVAETIPSKTYSSEKIADREHYFDTMENGVKEFNSVDEQIEQVAERYDVDEDELREEVIKSVDDPSNITKEEIEGVADFLAREPKLEPKDPGTK